MSQRKKVPFYTLWDYKSIVWIVGILFLIPLFHFLYTSPDLYRNWKISQYQGETYGRITMVKAESKMVQSRYGHYEAVDYYLVRYTYEVNGRIYNKEEKIQGTKKNGWYIRRLEVRNYQDWIPVKFDLEKPWKSQIIIDRIVNEP